jgi:hypothetical protein
MCFLIFETDLCKGTTFSGVAFAFATNTEAKEDIITEWPGAGNQTKQKVSSTGLTAPFESDFRLRFPRFFTTTRSRESLDGDQTLPMRSHQLAIPSQVSRK